MNRNEYKNNHKKNNYDRLEIIVPKGGKSIIKTLATSRCLSVNKYILDLIRKDQDGFFDTVQIAEKNRRYILNIQGNKHDGYEITFINGYKAHCISKKTARDYIIKYCRQLGG